MWSAFCGGRQARQQAARAWLGLYVERSVAKRLLLATDAKAGDPTWFCLAIDRVELSSARKGSSTGVGSGRAAGLHPLGILSPLPEAGKILPIVR